MFDGHSPTIRSHWFNRIVLEGRMERYFVSTVRKLYHSKGSFSLQYPCTVEDIGKNGRDMAIQELKGLQPSDCRKLNQLQTMQQWPPVNIQ